MPIAWFIVPYARRPGMPPSRYPAIDDYTVQIHAARGCWAETEVLGDRAIVKVRAPLLVLQALNARFRRLPKDRLDDSLADLSPAARQAIRDELLDAGYTSQEIQTRFGDDLGQYTLRDVLHFFASRRRKPRYDDETDQIVLDGEIQNCRSIEAVDAEVQE